MSKIKCPNCDHGWNLEPTPDESLPVDSVIFEQGKGYLVYYSGSWWIGFPSTTVGFFRLSGRELDVRPSYVRALPEDPPFDGEDNSR